MLNMLNKKAEKMLLDSSQKFRFICGLKKTVHNQCTTEKSTERCMVVEITPEVSCRSRARSPLRTSVVVYFSLGIYVSLNTKQNRQLKAINGEEKKTKILLFFKLEQLFYTK